MRHVPGLVLFFGLTCHSVMAQDGQPAPFAAFDLASEQVLNDPHDLALGPDGMIYIADKFAGRVVVMDPETLEVSWTFGDGALTGVHDVSFGPEGRAHVAVTGASRVDVFEIGDKVATLIESLPGLSQTEGVLAHSDGRIYVTAGGTGQLVRFDGETGPAATPGLMPGAHDVEEAPDGSVWVADNFARRLLNFDSELNLVATINHPKFGLIGARYLDIDDFGRLVVADQDGHRILLIDPTGPDGGTLLGVLGDGQPGMGPGKFDDPEGVLIMGSRYYFADSDNNRIVRYSVVIN